MKYWDWTGCTLLLINDTDTTLDLLAFIFTPLRNSIGSENKEVRPKVWHSWQQDTYKREHKAGQPDFHYWPIFQKFRETRASFLDRL